MAVTNELKEAVKKMQAGDDTGFAVFYEQTYPYVYAKAKYIMREEQDSLDLTQETFIQAYRGIGSISDINNLYAWLGGIVYRQGMKIFNKKKELLVGAEEDYIFEDMVSGEATPEQAAEQKATADIVKGMIEELPALQRMAVLAFYYDNMKIDDIASMCECSSNTIKSRLNYAKKFLKEKVEAHEKKNRYKLCSVSPAIFLLAFKGLFAEPEYKMPEMAVENVYTNSCGRLNIRPQKLFTGADTSTVLNGTSATAKVTSTTAKVATATAAKTGIGIKIGLTVTALITAGGIVAAVIHHTNTTPKEPVAVAEQETETEEQSFSEMQTEETTSETNDTENDTTQTQEPSIYNEDVPMEGLYQFGAYTISITNATVTDYKTATFDMELTYKNPDTNEEETISLTSLNKSEGTAEIDVTSNLGNRWFGTLMFMRDNSIRLNLSKQDKTGDVWDVMWEGSAVILTKAAANGIIQDRMPENGTYIYTKGNDVITDGGFTLTISEAEGNSFKMNFEITYAGDDRLDGIITDGDYVNMYNGIATFTGKSYWDSGMQGYLYVNEDGSITLSYSSTYGAEDGSFESVVMKKQ